MSGKSRRRLLQELGAALSLPLLGQSCTPQASPNMQGANAPGKNDLPPRKFLFVFGAMGGASINDSFLAVRESETKNYKKLNTFPDQFVVEAPTTGRNGMRLRAVDFGSDKIGFLPFEFKSKQSDFLAKYGPDIMVATVEASTVAHNLGQYRAVTGNNAWNGRTLQEAVAAYYGSDLLLPNVNMSTLGFAEHGKDPTLPEKARAHIITDPRFVPFMTHGYKGLSNTPSDKLMQMARRFRAEKLETAGDFLRRSGNTKMVKDWLAYRDLIGDFERLDLINQLNAIENSSDLPFRSFGLEPNADGDTLRDIFPKALENRLQAQALLGYLMVAKGLTCAVTFGIGMDPEIGGDSDDPIPLNVPSGFDFSHNAHRETQALLWGQTLNVIDRLITLLKSTEFRQGESLWQHSMIYIATEFGRDKDREEGDAKFTSGHHQNNGAVIISPMANGGQILGGIDRDSLLTYGFDPITGEPNPKVTMSDKHIYAGILQSLSVDTSGSGLPAVPAMSRTAPKV